MGAAARRPLAVGLCVTLLALMGGALALRLSPTTASSSLVGSSSASFRATELAHRRFGDDAVIILIRGTTVAQLVLTSDLNRLVGMEGCLSGNVPAKARPVGGAESPCARLAAARPAKVVIGPGTFINTSVNRITDEYEHLGTSMKTEAQAQAEAAYRLAKGKGYGEARAKRLATEAGRLVVSQYRALLFRTAISYGLLRPPTLNDQSFIAQLVFAPGKKAGTPKAKFAYLFPNASSALIQVRLRAGLGDDQRKAAIARIRQVTEMPQWRLQSGGQYVVTGAPVVLTDLTASVSHSIVVLLLASLLVMALTLTIVFRARLRLLPLLVALAAAGITFGALSLSGASLTMASIGVVPVLIGLAVDYAIQLQARIEERLARTADRGRAGVTASVAHVARAGAPTVAVAAAATAAGFLVLLLSPVPMVRGFGLLLVGGIAVGFLAAVTLGVAGLALLTTGRPAPRQLRRVADVFGPALRGAGEVLGDNALARRLAAGGRGVRGAALHAAVARPGRVLAAGLVVALAGWAAGTHTPVESDVTKLVPQHLQALRDLQALERATGVGGQIDVLVRSDHLTDPQVLAWMTRYQASLVKRFGYREGHGCGRAELCPAFSLPDLFKGSARPTRATIEGLLDAVPPYFSQSVITADRRTATLAFGIRLMPLDRQEHVLEVMRATLHPPAGVRAELAGLPVLAADADAAVGSSWRRVLTLVAGLIAVALVLLIALRSRRRALVPLVPIAMATGWSALLLFVLQVSLNPMSVTLGALVIAISTEFSVLLSERYRSERAAGHDPATALERTYHSTGAAVLASGATAIAGFAVLTVSDIRMLRDFGAVTVVDLTVSLLGVLLVLPSALVLGERRRRSAAVAERPAPSADPSILRTDSVGGARSSA